MKKIYLVYLDEFGHVGPYISKTHLQHNTSPIFGFGGLLIPADQIRSFSTWFYKLKCDLLAFEIQRDGIPPFQWEKKGAALYTTTNVRRYKELRRATFRLLNKIHLLGGFVFYVGVEKTADPANHRPNNLSFAVLKEAIKRLDHFCSEEGAGFLVFLDHRPERVLREAIVEVTQREMYGDHPKWTLLEAPTQIESHLYQTMQCADWLCGLIGRLEAFRCRQQEFQDFEWSEKYFGQRMKRVSLRSGVRRQANLVADKMAVDQAASDEGFEVEAKHEVAP